MAGQVMSGQDIYDNFANAVGPSGLTQSADHINAIQSRYHDRAAQIKELAAEMEEGWSGDAAGAATRGAGPLEAEHTYAAEAMSAAQAGLTTQAEAWHSTKSRVQPVPPVAPAPASMPALLGDTINAEIESQTQKSNSVATANVEAMKRWSVASDETGRFMPTSYGQIDANAMNISAPSASGPGAPGPVGPAGGSGGPVPAEHRPGLSSSSPELRNAGGYTPPTGAGAAGPAHRGSVPPGATSSGQDQSTVPNSYVTPSAQPELGHQATAGTPGMYRPGLLDPGPPGNGSSSGDSWHSGGLAVGGGPVGGASGGGSTGSGSGSVGGRAGSENSLGGGRGSGTGVAEGAATRSGASSSAAGRPGSPGVGGMGAGAGKKSGGADEEHERKFVLSDDEAFLATEDGQRLIDPQTGMAASPPVIGEAPKKRV
ncbi:hypothetical protein [Amycolatopsis benzoatilytica]|uniref:hypothetical protein n=1 Tax=Amycolatopsis benzoatilytica TaxID=346045 RepID=UPI0012B69A73|nr:hypothetical protein [Amycolatopsis benzoatilytica]